MIERGENFTTQDLIKEADVALQTFYRHFGGKDQILLAVLADLIAGHCEALAAEAEHLDGPRRAAPLLRRRARCTMLVANPGASGARFMTSQHWRLHQLYPEELADGDEAVRRSGPTGAREARPTPACCAPRSPERDAWLVNRLVMSVFHHYAFADDAEDAATIAEDVWPFCLAAVGGRLARRLTAALENDPLLEERFS